MKTFTDILGGIFLLYESRFTLCEDLSLESIADKCPYNMTGADFYALVSDAVLIAIKRKIDMLEAGKTDMLKVAKIDAFVF
jgi:SpoVK/Ycf46/Vps4 family AAA+-type ATPase